MEKLRHRVRIEKKAWNLIVSFLLIFHKDVGRDGIVDSHYHKFEYLFQENCKGLNSFFSTVVILHQ